MTGVLIGALPWRLSGQESAAKVENMALVPGLGRFHGERNGSPLQYSCPGSLLDSGAWQSTVYGVAKESDKT